MTQDPPSDEPEESISEKSEVSNLRALAVPGSIGAVLNDLVRQAAAGEIVQIAFVTSDDQGSLTADWDESVELEDLCMLKDFLVMETYQTLADDQYGDETEA